MQNIKEQLKIQLTEIMSKSSLGELFTRTEEIDYPERKSRSPHVRWKCSDKTYIKNFELWKNENGLFFRILQGTRLPIDVRDKILKLGADNICTNYFDFYIEKSEFSKKINKIYEILISDLPPPSSNKKTSGDHFNSPSTLTDITANEKKGVDHYGLLSWFEQHAGQVLTWEQLQAAPDTVTISAKGIYKPKSLPYALSIRQTLDSPYSDQEPEYQNDGSWRYRYSQEEAKKGNSATLFTNLGLKQCMDDGMPVAVLRQLTKKPDATRYQVMGLANVVSWEGGVFTLQSTTLANLDAIHEKASANDTENQTSNFDPQNVEDTRKKTKSDITKRQGQPAFRSGLLTAYNGHCAITRCTVVQVLEAAHITPYLGPETNHISNGLLLRSDLHSLWDSGMIYLNDDFTLQIKSILKSTSYEEFAGKKIYLPKNKNQHPSISAIQAHRAWSEKKN